MASSIKPTGMASGAAALRYWERRQEISSNNLANVSTDGYKGERAFARLVENGLPRVDAITNYQSGSIRPSENPLDIAIEGDGFVVVQTPQGERLSRGGSLSISASNVLIDSNGNPILGQKGPIVLSSLNPDRAIGEISILKDGSVSVDGHAIDTLRIEQLTGNQQLQRAGTGLFIPPQNRTPSDGEVSVLQGALEESNISPIGEMVDMISIQRAYSAVQRAISTLDSARGIAVTELGKPV